MKHLESKLQIECVKWFRLQYPFLTLFAIPNGGRRGIIEATIMKKEGILAGVPDLFLAKAVEPYHGLFIEMKSKNGKLSESQKRVRIDLLTNAYDCIIVDSFDSFVEQVNNYLK
jgi:hypothetical protein